MIAAADRIAVHELLALHGHLVDEGEMDDFDRVFTADVSYDVSAFGGGVLRGPDEVRAAGLALAAGNPVAHHVTNVVVEERGEAGELSVRSKGLGLATDGSLGSVTYDDVVVRTPSGWRISSRVVRPRREPLRPG